MANWPFTKNEDAFNKTVLFFTTKITQNLEIRNSSPGDNKFLARG